MPEEKKFSPANSKQQRFLKSKKRYVLMSGAVGAGKSYMGCVKGFMLNLMYPGNRGLIVRKENTSLTGSTVKTLIEQVIPEEYIVSYDKISGVLKHKTGVPEVYSEIVFSGLDKKADQNYPTKIGSTEYGWIFADETVELSEEDWQVLATRLRFNVNIRNYWRAVHYRSDLPKDKELFDKKMVRQLFGATNPDAPSHHLYKFFFENKNKEDRELIMTNPYDNPFLEPDYLRSLENSLSGLQYERLLLGKWVQAEGIIYNMFCDDHIVSDNYELPYPANYKDIFSGADSNYPLPRAGVFVAVKGDVYIVLDEFYMKGAHVEQLGNWLSEKAETYEKDLTVYHDPSDPAAIDQLCTFSMVVAEKADNKVLPGISEVCRLFNEGKLFIHERCVNLIRELQNYRWKKDEQPLKEEDHAVDALRYALMSHKSKENVKEFDYAFI